LDNCKSLVPIFHGLVSRQTPREEVARDAIEVIEVAKASLDHSQQMLAIALQKALRLGSIKRCKLFFKVPPCLYLVLVRMGV